jgi:hypothetical protein
MLEGVVGKPVGVRVRRTRTGFGRRREGGKARRTGARQPEAAPPRPMAWMAMAQAVESPLRHHNDSKGDSGRNRSPLFSSKKPRGEKLGKFGMNFPRSSFRPHSVSAPFLTECATNQYSCGIRRLLHLPGGNLGRSGPSCCSAGRPCLARVRQLLGCDRIYPCP